MALAAVGVAIATPLLCQTAPDRPWAFEVASIKQHVWTNTGMANVVVRMNPPSLPEMAGRRFSYRLTTIKILVALAYDMKPHQLLGLPDWAGAAGRNSDEYYDVEALAPIDNPTRPQLEAMLQSLLAERCRLQTHRMTSEVPVCLLTIAKGGPKFAPITGDPTSMAATMYTLVQSLSTHVEYPILDRTGLTGSYIFPSLHAILVQHPESTSALSALLAENFGLQLVTRKEIMEVLVVDSVRRPSAN